MNFKSILLKQESHHDCGVTALRMLLAYVHQDYNYLTLKFDHKVDTFLLIKNTAHDYKVSLEGYAFENVEELISIKGPFIMQIKKGNINHFVLARIRKHQIEINDPSGENVVITLKSLHKYNISNILVVNCVEKTVSPPRVRFGIKRTAMILQIGFLCFLALGFGFLGHPRLDLISYAAFTLAAIIKISEEHVLMNSLLVFDKEYVGDKVSQLDKNFSAEFEKIQKAKSIVFSYSFSLLAYSLTLIFMSVIFALNNYLLVAIIIFLLIMVIVDNRKGRKEQDNQFTSEYMLSDLQKAPNAKRKEIYVNIVELSTKIVKQRRFKNIIIHFGLAVVIFVLMYFSNTYSLNFFIFYFFGFAYYYDQLRKLVALLTNKAEYYQSINILSH